MSSLRRDQERKKWKETEAKDCGRHVRGTSETAVGHREKRNQPFKEHNRLLRISAFLFGYVTLGIVGRSLEKIERASYRVNHVISLIRTSYDDEIRTRINNLIYFIFLAVCYYCKIAVITLPLVHFFHVLLLFDLRV